MDGSTELWSILLLEKVDMMGLAGRGARNAQRTLAGEGSSRVPRDRGKVNVLKTD